MLAAAPAFAATDCSILRNVDLLTGNVVVWAYNPLGHAFLMGSQPELIADNLGDLSEASAALQGWNDYMQGLGQRAENPVDCSALESAVSSLAEPVNELSQAYHDAFQSCNGFNENCTQAASSVLGLDKRFRDGPLKAALDAVQAVPALCSSNDGFRRILDLSNEPCRRRLERGHGPLAFCATLQAGQQVRALAFSARSLEHVADPTLKLSVAGLSPVLRQAEADLSNVASASPQAENLFAGSLLALQAHKAIDSFRQQTCAAPSSPQPAPDPGQAQTPPGSAVPPASAPAPAAAPPAPSDAAVGSDTQPQLLRHHSGWGGGPIGGSTDGGDGTPPAQ